MKKKLIVNIALSAIVVAIFSINFSIERKSNSLSLQVDELKTEAKQTCVNCEMTETSAWYKCWTKTDAKCDIHAQRPKGSAGV